MGTRLKDIIDLDYLISMDDALESQEEILSRTIKDRRIYSQCSQSCKTDKELLFSWLAFRKTEFLQDKDKKSLTLLPGDVFSFLYTWMVYAMVFLGGLSGISLAYSFLAYHGTRPINVAVFIALFVVFQVILILLILILLIRRAIKKKGTKGHTSILHTLVSAFFFNVIPRILKKITSGMFKKSLDTLEYTASLIRMKNREYKDFFFWPFVILTSVFAVSFSTGALGGTFFRVIVSDMAFGWQSTLMATSRTVHEVVSFIALPWSWFVPQALAHPSLEQIEGSRIILKEGISVLATRDLVSWWPFLCMGILFYAVIPRGLFLLAGILSQNHALQHFNFERPRFRQLIIRMQSPVLDIDADRTPPQESRELSNRDMEKNPIKQRKESMPFNQGSERSGQKAVILGSKSVYSDAAIKKIIHGIEQHLFFDVEEVIRISFDFDHDKDAIHKINAGNADQVILVHEVWQPPIRGLLHYIRQAKAALPNDMPLWIILTGEAGLEDLRVNDNDINFKVWKKAVNKLEDPDITVKRFIQ